MVGAIFDMDGVLVASESAHRASWKAVAKRRGLQLTDEEFRRSFGQTSREIIRLFWGNSLSDPDVRRLDDEKEATYRDLIRGMVPLMIGAREVLISLQVAGVPMAVATSGPRANVDLVLDETRIRGYFSAIVTGEDIEQGKPSPDCFLLAAERLRLAPSDCVVIEDAPVGLAAAVAAGMASIALVGSHPAAALKAAGADAVVQRLGEITSSRLADLVAA